MKDFKELSDENAVKMAMESLKRNNIDSVYVRSGQEAKDYVLSLIPKGAEVMTMQSVTLAKSGIADAINNSPDYISIRKELTKLDHTTQKHEMKLIADSPSWTVGSVHAITQDGKVLIASNTGSQLPAYVYGADHVVWVVGTHKIVKDTDEGITRIYDYVLPLESERLNKAYNTTQGSFVSKLLIVNREIMPGRAMVIFVNEAIGF